MKILILNDVASPIGGAELLTIALRQGMKERGHDARIFASSAYSESVPQDVDYLCHGSTSGLRTLNRLANPSAWVHLRQCLQEFQPEVVHLRSFTTQLSPAILPLLKNIPTLYHATWNELICPKGLKLLPDNSVCHYQYGRICLTEGCLSTRAWSALMIHMRLLQRWSGVFDRIVANSESMRQRLLKHHIGPVEVVCNGTAVCNARPPLNEPPTVTFAGRITVEKGIGVLIHAFARMIELIPTARLLIAGTGTDLHTMQQLGTDLGINAHISWLGHVPHSELDETLKSGWIHVVPSLCEEGFGQTAAEGSMRGTAVIATRAGGLEQIVVEGETGKLVEPGDVEALYYALKELMLNKEGAEKMGSAGRERALARYTQDSWLDQFDSHYHEMMKSSQNE